MKPRSIIGKHVELGEYGCKKCKHYLPEHYRCMVDKCVHGDKNKFIATKVKNKCDGCKWSTWTGIKYFCMLPRCMPKLGSFNGVDKSGQTKKDT